MNYFFWGGGIFLLSVLCHFIFQACDRLLAQRVDMKMRSRKHESILNRIYVAEPVKRDDKERKPFIPSGW